VKRPLPPATRVEERQNVWMLQVRRRLDLGEKPICSHDGCQLRLEDLEPDLPFVLEIVGEVDGPTV
jgi:hypothetical protein